MGSSAIPAEGFRTFDPKNRPYLQSIAIEAVMRLHGDGVKVPLQAVAVLLILCDKVYSVHGQFYGAWHRTEDDKPPGLMDQFPWSPSTWFKWLAELEQLGLVKDLGYLPGRRTTTWQVLPGLYRLVSEISDTSEEVENDADVSENPDVSTPRTRTSLVSELETLLLSENPDANSSTTSNSDSNIELPRGSAAGEIHIQEEERERQKRALRELESRHG